MSRRQEIVDTELAERARRELSGRNEARIGKRLQAIASCATHPMQTVAAVFGVHRRTVWQWAKRFRADGIAGLEDRPGRGRRPLLTVEQQGQMEQWLEQGCTAGGEPVHWTLARLQIELEAEFGVKMSLTSIWKRLRKTGFRQKVPRPHHCRADPEAGETFKKKSPKSPRRTKRTRTP